MFNCYMIAGILSNIHYFRIGFAYIGRVGSVAVTVSISVERYINCCFSNHDFAFKSLLVPFPIIFSLVYNVPKFFELTPCEVTNETLMMENITFTNTPNVLEYSTPINIQKTYNIGNSSPVKSGDYIALHNSSNLELQDITTSSILNITGLLKNESTAVLESPHSCPDGYRTTWLRNNSLYIIFYVFWSKFLLVELIPWITIIILPIATTRKIQQYPANRDRLLGANKSAHAQEEGLRNLYFNLP